jgi:tRNA-2-methylthio-N6-dimethylallyladenosine synthase
MTEHTYDQAIANILSYNQKQHNQTGHPFRYHIITYGCQMNEHDSEVLAGLLEMMGYQHTDDLHQADLVLFNTCCVRESAEDKIYGKIGSLKPIKTDRPSLLVGVCGCMAQKPQEAARIRKQAPFVDFVLGTDSMSELPETLEQLYLKRERIIVVSDNEYRPIKEQLPRSRKQQHKAWVAIMHGCDNFCTYCIVPYVRGRERSRLPGDIIAEIIHLAQGGVREVTLLGQNVNSYGRGLSEQIDFSDLLCMIDKVPGIERIRFMTSHPKDLSQRLIQVMTNADHICQHIHLPVQAGSNKLLREMNRGYTREYYLKLVEMIRNAMPDCSISTDIIVGFPGETEADFADTLALTKEVRWQAAYTFLYSNRSGTKAAEMANQIEEGVKKERLQRLMELQNKISLEIHQSLVGTIFSVMLEGASRTNPDVWAARTAGNHLVLFPKDHEAILKPGDIADVRILEAKTWTLHGQLIEKQ